MGQCSSVPMGGRRKSFRASLRSVLPRRPHTHQGTLSATFNYNDTDLKIDQLNVNTATEEELMTLPGITRSIAQNIVEYRQAIGKFNKVEDLALVTGIGANKLDLIRPEICVTRKKNVSCSSSRAQSLDSLPSTESNSRSTKNSPYNKVLNVNKASVFELMTVHGLNQELAANIVEYRDRKGFFRSLDDLAKVKGFNYRLVNAIRCQLFLETCDNLSSEGNSGKSNQNFLPVANGKVAGHRKAHSAPVKYGSSANGFLAGKDIFELLSTYSERPIVEEDFCYEHNGRCALRIASWNLQDFTSDKADNPGVREVICRTILENRFSVIAVQEVVDALSLKKVCDELNNPTLRRVAEWKENQREWKFSIPDSSNHPVYKVPSGLGFLYDTSCRVELSSLKELCLTAKELTSLPKAEALLGVFRLHQSTVSVLNVYLHNKDIKCSGNIEMLFLNCMKEDGILIILGDFSGLSVNKEDNDVQKSNCKSIISSSTNTNSNGPHAARQYDSIFLNTNAQQQYTGKFGVIRQGLSHLAIPRGWSWGGTASDHCPVWCELYTEPSSEEKQIPNGTVKE